MSPSSLPLTSMLVRAGWKATCVTSWAWVSSKDATGRCSAGRGSGEVLVVAEEVKGRMPDCRSTWPCFLRPTLCPTCVLRSQNRILSPPPAATRVPFVVQDSSSRRGAL